MRELQSFISFLLFGGRRCQELLQSSGAEKFSLPNLVYAGEGKLFDAIRITFDPAKISHPGWDDKLVYAETSENDWIDGCNLQHDAIDPDNWDRFVTRKRAFFFFDVNGDALLSIAEDDETEFGRFLELSASEARRTLIKRINRFFGDVGTDKIRVWQNHRYNQSPRRMFYATQERSKTEFEVIKPQLTPLMSQGFDFAQEYAIFRLRDRHSIKLKVDFLLFQLLLQSECGVPVVSLEGDANRRLWQFMEHLSDGAHIDMSETTVTISDSTTSEQITITVNAEIGKYISIVQGE